MGRKIMTNFSRVMRVIVLVVPVFVCCSASSCKPDLEAKLTDTVPAILQKYLPAGFMTRNFRQLSASEQVSLAYNPAKKLYPTLIPLEADRLLYCPQSEKDKFHRYQTSYKGVCPLELQYECIYDQHNQIVKEFCCPTKTCSHRERYVVYYSVTNPYQVELQQNDCSVGYFSQTCYDEKGCHRDVSMCVSEHYNHLGYCNARWGFCNKNGDTYFNLNSHYVGICTHSSIQCGKGTELLSDCRCGDVCHDPSETRTEDNTCQKSGIETHVLKETDSPDTDTTSKSQPLDVNARSVVMGTTYVPTSSTDAVDHEEKAPTTPQTDKGYDVKSIVLIVMGVVAGLLIAVLVGIVILIRKSKKVPGDTHIHSKIVHLGNKMKVEAKKIGEINAGNNDISEVEEADKEVTEVKNLLYQPK